MIQTYGTANDFASAGEINGFGGGKPVGFNSIDCNSRSYIGCGLAMYQPDGLNTDMAARDCTSDWCVRDEDGEGCPLDLEDCNE